MSQPTNPSRALRLSDLKITKITNEMKITEKRLELRIRSSKTDKRREGDTHWFGQSKNGKGPLEAAHYIIQLGRSNGLPTSARVQDIVEPALKTHELRAFLTTIDEELSTHSMRCGGAVTIAAKGVPWEDLKKIGRWSTDCAPQAYTQGVSAATINRVKTIEENQVIRT